MEKRVALAIFLCFVVLVIYQALLPKPPVSAPAPVSAGATAGPAGAPATPPANPATPPAAGASAASMPGAPAVKAAPTAPAAAPLVTDTSPHEIVVDTDAIHAVFTTAGARLTSWQLKKYFNGLHQALDLVPSDIPDTYARPFTLTTDDAAMSATIANALYQPSTKELNLGSAPGDLSFDYKDSSGLSVHKTFHFQPEGKPYLLAVDAAIAVDGKSRPVVLSLGPGIGAGYNEDGSRDLGRSAVQLRADKVERLPVNKLSEQSRFEGTQRFAGVEDQYFLSVVLPGEKPVRVDYQPVTLPVPNDPKGRSRTFVAYDVALPNAASLTFFMGPKDLDILRGVDSQLVRVINFGFFAVIVVPLLQALKWIHGIVGNYGWSIVVLTILINLLMFPLRHRSMVSMRKMQALQPQIKAIQERYKNFKMTDPEKGKMNQEMMALYKAKGVSPMSGCFPMLLTMPVLYAFYSLLSASIELRGAPFMGWIHDLALKDPLYITPILMGGTMFWQQRMMPSTADPVQQKMFLFMPLLFTVMFLAAPSGLVIYWLVSNVMAVGQQYMTNRMIGAPAPARAVKPAPQKT